MGFSTKDYKIINTLILFAINGDAISPHISLKQ